MTRTAPNPVGRPLNKAELKQRIAAAIAQSDPGPRGGRPTQGVNSLSLSLMLDRHLDRLIEVARQTDGELVETYQAQLIEHVCPHCHFQAICTWCPYRYTGTCPLFTNIRPIIETISSALEAAGDEQYRHHHPPPPWRGADI